MNVFIFTYVHLKGGRGSPRAAGYIKEGLLYAYSVLVLFFKHSQAVLIRDRIVC